MLANGQNCKYSYTDFSRFFCDILATGSHSCCWIPCLQRSGTYNFKRWWQKTTDSSPPTLSPTLVAMDPWHFFFRSLNMWICSLKRSKVSFKIIINNFYSDKVIGTRDLSQAREVKPEAYQLQVWSTAVHQLLNISSFLFQSPKL